VPGVILIVQRYELSPVDISEIGMLCGRHPASGSMILDDGYIKAKNNYERKRKTSKKGKIKKGGGEPRAEKT
jgi:hypothetical protein